MNTILEDSEELIFVDCNNRNNDLFGVTGKLYDNIKWKISFFIFILYIILNSDIFVENILSKFIKGTYDQSSDKPTERGILVSGVVLSILYITIDLIYENGYI